ncbi:MAG: rod shape-determining protein [Zetaproteobacteria bacterium]|nr:rod shape-determining protein [Zetaproteobacteria bacterium]
MSQTFYVGIDLGTSRSSIATSTGKRLTIGSCVGFPKDMVSHKRFGRDFLLGDEALENRLGLNLIWPLADGVLCEDQQSLDATALLLKALIAEALPEFKTGDRVHAAIGVPAQANKNNKVAIIALSQSFIDRLIIVSEPFAVAYSVDRFDECLIVDIGAGTTDLCRMHGSMPEHEDQLTLTTAGNFLDEVLTKKILEKFPKVQLSQQIVKRIKEKHGYVSDVSLPIMVKLTEKGIIGEYDISDVLKASCLELVNPITAAVQELVGTFDPDFQERLRNNIIVAGGGSRLKGIDKAIEDSLEAYGGGNATCVQDAEHCGSTGALSMSMEMPDAYWEQL